LNSADPLARFRDRLSLPLIAAPMFLVSGVDPRGGGMPQRGDRRVPDRELPQLPNNSMAGSRTLKSGWPAIPIGMENLRRRSCPN